jgi:sensor histidine kinase YesM
VNILLNILRQQGFLIPIFFFLQVNTTRAQQNNDYYFQKLNTLNGLSSDHVQCIFRDSHGYVWIGTNNGFNRYDSRNIKIYHHDADNSHSIPRDDIQHIAADHNGILWLGADYGLIEFNPITEQFNYYCYDANNPKSLKSDHVPIPFVDSKNKLWVSTEKGLFVFDRKNHNFETAGIQSMDPETKKHYPVLIWNLLEDKNYIFWGIGEAGLYRFDPSKSELKVFPPPNNGHGAIADILIDHDGYFWVVQGSHALCLFHPEKGQYELISLTDVNRTIGFGKICERKDPSGEYWLTISTDGGLVLFNYRSGENILVHHDPANPYSLTDNATYYIYSDQDNILWIGTIKGLNILDNNDQLFHAKTIVQGNSFKDRRVKGFIETIHEDPDLKMISFWWGKGMGIYSKDWKPIRFYLNIPPSDQSLEARDIFGIYRDYRGIYWISTDNGLVKFDLKNNSFKVFMPPDVSKMLVSSPKFFREIVPFDNTSFYVRSKIFGIYKFDFVKEKFVQHLTHNKDDSTSLPSNNLRAVIKDADSRLIILSVDEGIFIYNSRNNTYEIYNHDTDVSINEALHNLYVDPSLSGKILWANSAHGLLKFDLVKNKFELFNSRNGLANDFLISNEVDNRGNVWVAHNAGISKFDTGSRRFTNYSENYGLTFRDLGNNMKEMADGNIYIGDQDRFIYFNPSQFRNNQKIPQVHINSVQVLNEPFIIRIDSNTQKKSMTLAYDQELITVNFSVLNFSHSKENGFYYRLDFDSMWHKLNEGSVNLVRLSPGKYVLYVTGSNDSGIMNPAGDSLYINILPPYYRTWWFMLLLVMGVIFLIFEFRRRGIKRIKREEKLKTEFNKQLAQAETKALRAQMNPHFIFNSLNSINSFVMDQKHEIASDYLIKFSKLIRLILDNSRSETISIDKELETLKLYVLLESARFDNKFKCVYLIAEDVNTNTIMIPPMLLQPFVENAIWHGLMQKETDGTITIEIKQQKEEFLNISITDDGIGREKAAELKSKSATHKSQGLKVTSQRIEMMNKLNSKGAQVQIIDLKDDQGHATGTRVELIIPF